MIERLSYDKRIIHYEMEHLMIRMTNKYLKEIPFLFRQRMEIQYGLMKGRIDQIRKENDYTTMQTDCFNPHT